MMTLKVLQCQPIGTRDDCEFIQIINIISSPRGDRTTCCGTKKQMSVLVLITYYPGYIIIKSTFFIIESKTLRLALQNLHTKTMNPPFCLQLVEVSRLGIILAEKYVVKQ